MVALIALSFTSTAQVSEKESQARLWIKENETKLKINPNDTFKLRFVRKTQAGETLRFQQEKNGVSVFDSEILIHFSPDGEISYTDSTYDTAVADINTVPAIDKQNAIAISNQALEIGNDITFQDCNLLVYNKLGSTKLVYRVLTDAFSKSGSWETILDAKTGAVLSTKDIALYYGKHKHTEHKMAKPVSMMPLAPVTGTALVFNPDPLSQARASYGSTGYTDASDAASNALNNARVSVVLPEIDLTGGVYTLKSSYAEIKELGAPAKGIFTQASPNFLFTRSQDGFEAANAFYHIDKNLRYINQTLGIPCAPYQAANAGVVFFDPHGASSQDQSFYTNGQLQFGEGGVDDAEDADVVLHELGHGIHDWITGGGLSQVNGLSEGCGDYWASSYSRSLSNQWGPNDEQYNWVFNWDGHNSFWDGRITNYEAVYPGGLINQIHTDGQIWATALMKIWDELGREKTDKAFLNGLDLTVSSTNQQNAARAVRLAAINMNYACADVAVITQKFTEAGYNMPALALSMAAIANQSVTADANNTYTLPSYASLANPITTACNATLTQNPPAGTILAPGVHTITMQAVSGAATVTRSFQLTITASMGIDDASKNNFRLYPNPAMSVINIKGDFDSNESITVYNMLGQTVLTKAVASNEETLDISSLTPGIYNVYFNNAKVTYKFVKK